jgi:hypothetical protein
MNRPLGVEGEPLARGEGHDPVDRVLGVVAERTPEHVNLELAFDRRVRSQFVRPEGQLRPAATGAEAAKGPLQAGVGEVRPHARNVEDEP